MTPERITDEWVRQRLDQLWPVHTAAFTRLVLTLRDLFDGDLDAMLILSTVAYGVEAVDWRDTLLGERQQRARKALPINASSIADVTGIPRETVRRKLDWMQSKGWIARDARAQWTLLPRVAEDLEQGTVASVAYLRTVLAAGLDRDTQAQAPSGNRRKRD